MDTEVTRAMAFSAMRHYERGGLWRSARRRSRARLFVVSLATLLFAIARAASAAKWEIVPSISGEETYTDNVRLAPPDAARSDWVTQFRPGLSIRGSGDRLNVNFAANPQILRRAREGTSSVSYPLHASGTMDLFRQLLFVDASASVSRQNVSLLGPQAESDVNNTGNRTTVKTAQISPYLRYRFGNSARGEARLKYNTVGSTASTALSSSKATGIDLKLASGPAYRLLTWNIGYDRQRTYYGGNQQAGNIDTQKFTIGGRRLITPRTGLVFNVGYEDNNYVTTGAAPKGAFWSVGPEWNPSPVTRLVATIGRRYFGSTRSLEFNHRTRLTVWQVNYREDITTARAQTLVPSTVDTASFLDTLFLSSIPDPTARRAAVEAYIVRNGLPATMTVPLNFLTDVPYLSKSLQASVALQGVRNTVIANAFVQTREATTPGQGDFAQSGKTRQTGASVLWNARISAQTSSNLDIGFTRSALLETGQENRQKFVRFGITRQFHPRLSGSLNLRRIQNDSSQAGASYKEDALSVAVMFKF